MRIALFLLAAAWLPTAFAHSVQHRLDTTAHAVVISLNYTNGKPFAHEKYALHAGDGARPELTGHTDSAGRVVFLPGAVTDWRLKTMAAHGHGLVIDLHLPPAQPAQPVPPPATPPDPPTTPASPVQPAPAESGQPSQASLALFGLSLLFGGFGAYQLFLRRRRS